MSSGFSYVAVSGHGEAGALLFGTRWNADAPITFSFPGLSSTWDASYANPGEPFVGLAPLGAAQQQAVRSALLTWSTVANVAFAEVPDVPGGAGTLRFAYTSWSMNASQMAYAYAPNAALSGGDVWINASLSGSIFANLAPGAYASLVLVHEAGHALGLKHPHESSDLSAIVRDPLRDSIFDSVMSYYAWPGVLITRSNMDRVPFGPMALDIDAIQVLYGANATARGGDDVYAFEGAGRYLETLYDTGGNDTIVLNGTAGGEIDLRPDGWSQLGEPVRIDNGAIVTPDTVRIHRSTLIENAIGGSGGDVLIGNDAANRLVGRGGADAFVLGPGQPDVIADFNLAEGDWIDITRLSAGFTGYANGTDLFALGYLRAVQRGAHSALEYDADGNGAQAGWVALASLENVDAATLGNAQFAPTQSRPAFATRGLTLTGTSAADTLSGGIDDDVILGVGGDDSLDGRAGSDQLHGGEGSDSLRGGPGDDLLFGDAGADRLEGGGGRDTLLGGGGNDEFVVAESDSGSGTLGGEDGDDTFILSIGQASYSAALTGGPGQDAYRLLVPSAGAGNRSLAVADFVYGPGGDLIDLVSTDPSTPGPMIVSGNSGGYSGGNPFSVPLGFLRLVDVGADTVLQWDRDGAAGGAASWVSILTLANRSAASLRPENFAGGIEPDGSPGVGRSLVGTEGNDSLSGGVADDVIAGLGGDDTLDGGLGGADRLDGGSGSDVLRGGAGADVLLGGDGNDVLHADSGDDRLEGGAGDDILATGIGNDVLDGGPGADTIRMSLGPGLPGVSMISGGEGRDSYRFEWLGGGQADRNLVIADFAAGAGGDLLDLLSTDASAPGPMVVSADSGGYREGNPLDAALGFVRIVQSGRDAVLQWDRDGAAQGGAGWIELVTLRQVDALAVGLGSFAGRNLMGTAASDRLAGTWANDTLTGLDGNDVLDGREGADTMVGGAGADLYYVDDAGDVVVEVDADSASDTGGFRLGLDLTSTIDTVIASRSYALGNHVENLGLAPGTARLDGSGNGLDNELTGNAGTNRLEGGGGNDTLHGGGADDLLDGGPGVDTAVYSGRFAEYTIAYQPLANTFSVADQVAGRDGSDIVLAAERFKFADAVRHLVSYVRDGHAMLQFATQFSGPDIPGVRIDYQFIGEAGAEVAGGTESNDFFNLLGGDDAVEGGAGNDILDGGTGSNFLGGGAGIDTYFLDGRGAVSTWSTIVDWEPGEQLAVWGWREGSHVVRWTESGQGGYLGATMHADMDNDGAIDTSVTWAGKGQGDLPVPTAYPEHQLLWFV